MITPAAFAAFYEQTATPLRKYVARCLGNPTLADDIVQEAYLRLLRHPPPSDEHEQRRAYLFRIASNLMTDGWRRRRLEVASSESDIGISDPDTAAHLDVQRTFLRLRPLDRQLLWLAYVEGESHRDIAATLGLREGSVRVLLLRARDKLLRMLTPEAQSKQISAAARCATALTDASLKLRSP